MSKISTGNFQKGIFINFRNEPHQIINYEFYNPGKGSAVVRSRLKCLKTGRVTDFTFKSGETVEEIPVDTREMQYLYKQGNEYVFMNQVNFEQVNLTQEMIGDFTKFMKEGDILQILLYEGNPLGVRAPKKVRLLVTQADEAVRGNSITGGAKKTVIVETGAAIAVPLFIKQGELVVIDTETGEYVERANQK